MKQISIFFLFLIIFYSKVVAADTNDFENWKINFKKIVLANNISEKTYNLTINNVKFLPNVIKYDRYQPEFYEDTKTYISKRTSKKKVQKGINFYKENEDLIKKVKNKFDVEK